MNNDSRKVAAAERFVDVLADGGIHTMTFIPSYRLADSKEEILAGLSIMEQGESDSQRREMIRSMRVHAMSIVDIADEHIPFITKFNQVATRAASEKRPSVMTDWMLSIGDKDRAILLLYIDSDMSHVDRDHASTAKAQYIFSPVSSSQISGVAYDDTKQILAVQFRTGDIYEYMRVDRSVYESFLAAPSAGRFLNQHIKDIYSYRKIADATPGRPPANEAPASIAIPATPDASVQRFESGPDEMSEWNDSQCWFCKTRPAVTESKHEIALHRVLHRKATNVVSGMEDKSQYENTKTWVPRCNNCWWLHLKAIWVFIALWLILGTCLTLWYFSHWEDISSDSLLINICGGAIAIVVIFSGSLIPIGLICTLTDICWQSEDSGKEHPRVTALTNQGWQIGDKPTNTDPLQTN